MSNKKDSDARNAGPANIDKRLSPRVPAPFIPLTLAYGKESVSCAVLNIGKGGALIQAPRELPRNSVITTAFSLPGVPEPLSCDAKVVWSRSVYDIHVRIGIRFDGCEAAMEKIAGYVDRQIGARPAHTDRATLRAAAPFIAAVINDGRKIQNGVILDISRSGVLIQTREPIAPGSVVTASFILPHTHKVVRTQAKVVWRKNLYGEFENKGLEFVGLDQAAEKYIGRFVEKQALCGV